MEASKKILALLIIAIILVTDRVHGRDCPTKYARFSTHHSYCLDQNATCSIVGSSVDQVDRNEIVRLHNQLRSKVAEGNFPGAAGDMLELTWDSELETIAQRWANQCIVANDCINCRTVENFDVGQNFVHETWSECTTDECIRSVKPDWKGVITMLYQEVSSFNKTYINPFQPRSEYIHFSQLVWARTWRLGCGYTVFRDRNNIRITYVCNYGPTGNYEGEPMFLEGKACSLCPSNTKCGKDGLCKVVDETIGPVYKEKTGNLLDCNWKAGNPPCQVKIELKGGWNTKRSLSGNYNTITLKGGEKSVMKMAAPIQPNSPTFCVVVQFRKSPTNAANKDSSKMTVLLYIPEFQVTRSIDVNYQSNSFTPFGVDIQWKMKTEISFEFSVPGGGTEHIFDVRKIEVFDGKCSDKIEDDIVRRFGSVQLK